MLETTIESEGIESTGIEAVRKPLLEASMLPTRTYTSRQFYEFEVESIFRKEWFCVGREEQLEKPGDYFTLTIIGEPLVVVRDQTGQINVLSRVCRHRGALVAEGAGNARAFECPYHAWVYSLQGKLVGAPYMNKTKGFSKSDCRLPSLRVECWEGFIFANFDSQAAALGPQLEQLSKRLAPYKLSQMRTARSLTYTGPFNWKVLLENNCEGYHHIGAHKHTAEPFFPGRLVEAEDTDGRIIFLNAPSVGAAVYTPEKGLPAIEGLSADQLKIAVNPVILPTHIMFIEWDLMTYFRVYPEGPEQTTYQLDLCLPRSTLELPNIQKTLDGMWEALGPVIEEDNSVLQLATQGLRAGLAQAGRYCHLDKGVQQLHQYILSRVLGN